MLGVDQNTRGQGRRVINSHSLSWLSWIFSDLPGDKRQRTIFFKNLFFLVPKIAWDRDHCQIDIIDEVLFMRFQLVFLHLLVIILQWVSLRIKNHFHSQLILDQKWSATLYQKLFYIKNCKQVDTIIWHVFFLILYLIIPQPLLNSYTIYKTHYLTVIRFTRPITQ